MDAAATIVHAPGIAGPRLLDQAIAVSGFREAAARRVEAAIAARGVCTAIVVPTLDAYHRGSPAGTDPLLVEHLLDTLCDLGAQPAVGGTRATSSLWLENRDVFVAADLLGYRYETPRGRPYDLVDLAEDLDDDAFATGGCLAGTGLSRAWRDCDLRIVFSANRTDEDEGYALTLATLLSVLPAADKDYQYRYRRDVGEVCAAVLAAAPVHFALIDAVVSSHGAGGGRAPRPIRTDTLIIACDPVHADHAGALKMGLDPLVSRLAAPSLRRAAPSPDRIAGPLEPYAGWVNAPPALVASTAARRAVMSADRSVRPWLQAVDREIFPFRDPVNDAINKVVAGAGDGLDGEAWTGDEGGALLTLANLWLAEAGKAGEAWGVMFDKDALRRREAPINIDLARLTDADYRTLPSLLEAQSDLLHGAPTDGDGVRWRFHGQAVVFDGVRRFFQPFEAFTDAVEIHRSIQFMNDYIGGAALITAHDADGRPTRQVERNLYLPQPNYTALGGLVIDVTKIETIAYGPRWRKMYWRTVFSENDSAVADDGVVSFEALGDDTLVTLWGRQQFRLPPVWAAIDEALSPEMKRALVSQAYGRFFQRTFANLEGIAEGRDMRIGRPWSDDPAGEPLPIERLSALVRKLEADGGVPSLLRGALGTLGRGRPQPLRIDEDGFRHFQGAADPGGAGQWTIGEAARDLRHAFRIDLAGRADRGSPA
jgi:hypothetical protein